MRFQTVAAGETWSVWLFLPAGRTVGVTVRDQSGSLVTLSSSTTAEDQAGCYRFNSSQISTNPTTLTHLLIVGKDSLTAAQDAVQICIGGHVDSIDATVSSRASQASVDALNDLSITDVQTALTNQGYTTTRAPKLDNLDVVLSTRASQTSVDSLTTAVVCATFTVASGSSTTEVRTNATQASAYWDTLTLVVVDGANCSARRIDAYAQTNGAFTVAALPFTPGAGASARVIGRVVRPDAVIPSVGAIADAVWDEPTAGHVTAGTFGLNLDDRISLVRADIAALNDIDQAGVQAALTAQGYTVARADNLDNLDAAVSDVLAAIAALNDLSIPDVQTALTNQGYTSARAVKLDNLDVAISVATASVLAAVAALNDLSIADVQTAMTAQGYTSARATLLDQLSNVPAILAAVEKVRKVTTNRVVVNLTDTTVTVYEDDETTPAFSFTISADRRERTPD